MTSLVSPGDGCARKLKAARSFSYESTLTSNPLSRASYNTGHSLPRVKERSMPNQKSMTVILPVPHCLFSIHLLPQPVCLLSSSSTGRNQIWKLFHLKSIPHYVFPFVGGLLLVEHIPKFSSRKHNRLFTSILTYFHCHSFALVRRYDTAPQNFKTNYKKIPKKQKTPRTTLYRLLSDR